VNKVWDIFKKNWVIFLLFFSYLIIYFWKDSIGAYLAQTEVQKVIGESLYQGWLGLVDYLSAHVLFCLIPAFFIAGAINTLINSQSILKYLSGKTKKWLAYLIASVGGFFIEVCSCTILPLFAGIWKKGAGLGIASTFLYAGPAINVISFILTGQRLGWDIGIIRLILSIIFSITVGLVMEFLFRNDKKDKGDLIFTNEVKSSLKGKKSKIFWIVLFAILLVGTAPINEFVKYSVIAVLVLAQLIITLKWLSKTERKAWWKETIKFTTDIIPLLLIGVFAAGAITHLIPQEQFQQFLGKNTLFTNFVAVLFGAIAYFPALVEVPIAENFLELGMDKGPLMAYLLSDPVLSLQGLLIISKLIGVKKTLTYTGVIVILTTLAGYLFGLFF
jgi:hypothetical protein